MPRIARIKHSEAVYFILVRGNNRENIFFDDIDRLRYLETVKRYKEKFQVNVLAYCLMDNNIQMVIDCNGQDISKVMQGINLSYTQYMNRKYRRCGHLFQDRFKSVILSSNNEIIQTTKYIHTLPVSEGMSNRALDYKWSSMNVYRGKKDEIEFINTELVLLNFSENRQKSKDLYVKYVEDDSEIVVSQINKRFYENSDMKRRVEGVCPNKVLLEVAEYFNVCVQDLEIRYSRRLAKARQVASYLIYLKSKLNYRQIGDRFGITASAVGQNISKALQLINIDKEIMRLISL